MTWPEIAGVLAAITLTGVALPTFWRFVIAAARVPLIIEKVHAEFTSNGGGSMRDSINDLIDDTKHLRESNHHIANELVAQVGFTKILADKIDLHTTEDAAQFVTVLDRLDTIDTGFIDAKDLAAEVKHDLSQKRESEPAGP